MNWQKVQFTPQEGIVNNGLTLSPPQNSFRFLSGCRLVQARGAIEQTPYFYSAYNHTAGTYWNGSASVSESESSDTSAALLVYHEAVGYYFSRYTAWAFAIPSIPPTQIQVIRQTTVPAAATITKHCLLVVNNYTDLGITLGSTLDVEIDAATTFKWRINGGVYTTGVTIASSVDIDSGSATLYFLTTTGFTVGDVWSWTRTDALHESGGAGYALLNDWSYAIGNDNIYFIDYAGRVMVYQNGGIRSVGYRPVFGSHIAIYYDHLVVASYSDTLPSTKQRTNVVAWSDLNDLDALLPTDVNEADSKTLVPNDLLSNTSTSTGFFGLSEINGTLHCYAANRVWTTEYLGLPTVFSWRGGMRLPYNAIFRTATSGTARPIRTPEGDYIVTPFGVVLYNGVSFREVSRKVSFLFSPTVNVENYTWGFYDSVRREVWFYHDTVSATTTLINGAGFLVYQESLDSWYFRPASFLNKTRAAFNVHNAIYISSGFSLHAEATSSASSPVYDSVNGAGFSIPYVDTCDMTFNGISEVKEINGGFIDTSYSTGLSGSYNTTNITFYYSTRERLSADVTFTAGGTWTTSSTDGSLSLPRVSGRIFRFRVIPIVSTASATFSFYLGGFEVRVAGAFQVEK